MYSSRRRDGNLSIGGERWLNRQDKMIAEQIIKNFDVTIRAYLEKNKDKAEEVKKFVAKYVKGGDYFKVTESALAAKLLADFKETFNVKE